MWDQFFPTQVKSGVFRLFDKGQSGNEFDRAVMPTATDTAQLILRLQSNDVGSISIHDQGQTPVVPWNPTAGLGVQIALKASSPSGGLTPQQDQALQEVHQSTFVDHLLDALTLDPMSPPGGAAGPFSRTLLTPTAGILVRMTSIAAGLLPDTPDGDYWLPSLAVIRLFRGSDLWKRIPVHTSSKLYYWLEENVVVGATQAVFSQWLLNMSVQVTIREGCLAEVFVLHYP
jgi:hypothetical protein